MHRTPEFVRPLKGHYQDVSENRGGPPKMDGENNGKPYSLMDDLGVFPYFWKHPPSITLSY